MAGVHYYNIEQIPDIGEDIKMIAFGVVIAIFRQENFLSLSITDSTATAEATYYDKKSDYQNMQIPNLGDTIQVLGTCLTKPIANEKKKLFLKIRLNRWRILNFDQELELTQRILSSRKWRFEKKLREEIVEIRKKVGVKEKIFSEAEMVDIRSLIFSYMYIVFSSNKDINSYLFSPAHIKAHHICKQYARENQIAEKSMEDAIVRALSYLLANQILQLKQPQFCDISSCLPEQYVIKKRYFERLVVDIEKFVYEKKNTGVTLEQVTKAMNQNMKFTKPVTKNYFLTITDETMQLNDLSEIIVFGQSKLFDKVKQSRSGFCL